MIAGQFLAELERHDDAADHYLKAAQLAPSEYEIVFNAANTLRQAGRNKEAEHYYRMAVQLRPQVCKGCLFLLILRYPLSFLSYPLLFLRHTLSYS